MTRTIVPALLFAAAAIGCGGGAHAIEVTKKIEINGTAADVWAKIGGFCAIKEWHPALADCEEIPEGELGLNRRVLTLKDGGQIKEKMTGRATTTYAYVIEESPLPVKNYAARFSVEPDDDDEDEVNVVWVASFDANGKSDDEAKKVIEGIFDAGLKSIQEKSK